MAVRPAETSECDVPGLSAIALYGDGGVRLAWLDDARLAHEMGVAVLR